ncbi:4'-phosphopantetheinyl transferase family protein [Janibacter anophelis]|uniref:4'-phosphopantetheinyl transferase family protein n=1 Tax=Janibacter anophelis TaxID=319054 RepID=UPI000DEF7094|nr:4'-phosphopantetheinyl transferase superfamily protein [Janibacter anophelis]
MWHSGSPTSSDAALRAHLHRWWSRCELASLETTLDLETGRHCPTCGSDAHGRPWVRLPDGTTPHVSLSRCGDHLVTVVADHPVGVDVESIAAVSARWDPTLVLHPSEAAHDLKEMRPRAHDLKEMRTPGTQAQERAATWCHKEAILKALGTGLTTPMSEIRVADWEVADIPAPQGCWASTAIIRQTGSGGSSTA